MRKLLFPVEYCFLVAYFFSKCIECEDVSFQYPCYVDVCTFPRQFCDSNRSERKCNDCLFKLCGSPDMPQACKVFCDKAAGGSEKKVEGSHSTSESETDPVPWIIISLLSVLCICLITYILANSTTVRRKIAAYRRRRLRNNPIHLASSETEMKVLVDTCHEGTDSRTQVVTSCTQL